MTKIDLEDVAHRAYRDVRAALVETLRLHGHDEFFTRSLTRNYRVYLYVSPSGEYAIGEYAPFTVYAYAPVEYYETAIDLCAALRTSISS